MQNNTASTDINRYQQISTDINRYQQISTDINRYQQISTDINRYTQLVVSSFADRLCQGGHSGNKHLTDLHIFDTQKLHWSQPEILGTPPPGQPSSDIS